MEKELDGLMVEMMQRKLMIQLQLSEKKIE